MEQEGEELDETVCHEGIGQGRGTKRKGKTGREGTRGFNMTNENGSRASEVCIVHGWAFGDGGSEMGA